MPVPISRETVLRYFEVASQAVLNAWAKGDEKKNIYIAAPHPPLIYVPKANAKFSDWHQIEGLQKYNAIHNRHEIHVGFPVKHADTGPEEYFEEMRIYAAGVCIHEYLHFLQERHIAGYKAAAIKYTKWRNSIGRAPTPAEEAENYYGIPFEQDSHGAQAAVEMFWDNKKFEETKLLEHITYRLNGQPLPDRIHASIARIADHYASQWKAENEVWVRNLAKLYGGGEEV